jgi:hypothetical protein
MKTVPSLVLALTAFSAAAQTSEPTMTFDDRLITFTNLEGKVFPDAHLVRADSKSIIVKTEDFYGNVPFTNLSQSTQEQLGLTADYMAETRAFQEGRAKASAAALERTKAILVADKEKMSDTNNLLKMTVRAFSGASVPSAYGIIYPCTVTLNGAPTRVYVARLPVAQVNGYITQLNQAKNQVQSLQQTVDRASGAVDSSQRQLNEDRRQLTHATALDDQNIAKGTVDPYAAALNQGAISSAQRARQADIDAATVNLRDLEDRLSQEQTQLNELQKTEPVLSVVTSGLMQGGLHVEIVVPSSN